MEGGGTMGDVAMPWASVLDRTDGQGGDLLGDVIGLPGGRMEEPGDRSSMKRGQDAMAERGESQQQLQDEVFLQAWVDANQSLGRGMGMSEGGSAQEGEEEEEETDMLTSDAQRKPSASYQEKELREAAAAEVAEKRAREKTEGSLGSGNAGGGGGGSGGGPGSGGSQGDGASEHTGTSGGGGSSRRRGLTAEERAAQSRYRNREHARNTRLRKKAYMNKLKELVDDLERQRKEDSKVKEAAASKLVDQQVCRKQIVTRFLNLRATNERDRSKWAAVVDESFVMTLPITPYRYFPRTGINHSLRLVAGITAAMVDAASLQVMAEGMGRCSGNANRMGTDVVMRYMVNENEMVMSRDALMCRWVFLTENAVACGALAELAVEGMMYCTWSAQHKLLSVEMMFDVMAVMQQLQRASGLTGDALIVPNSLEAACHRSSTARVIVKAEPPFQVLHVNEQWTAMRGQSQAELEGRPLDLLQTSVMDPSSAMLVEEVMMGRPTSLVMGCFKATGEPFEGYLQLFPLSDNTSCVTHMLGVLREVTSWLPPRWAGQTSSTD